MASLTPTLSLVTAGGTDKLTLMSRGQAGMLTQPDLGFSNFQWNFCCINRSLGTSIHFKIHISDPDTIKAYCISGSRLRSKFIKVYLSLLKLFKHFSSHFFISSPGTKILSAS
jgi:hypothetical protein